MWKLSSNRLSHPEYVELKITGLTDSNIIQYARKHDKQCNSNLCSLYKHGIVEENSIKFYGQIVTVNNLDQVNLNKAYIPYFREHFGLPARRNTIITSDFLINNVQLQVLIGSILGDGYIPRKCNYFALLHGIKQIEYLKWKAKQLGELIRSNIKERSYWHKKSNKILTNVFVNTIPHRIIKDLRQEFYKPDKRPSLLYINQLNALGLAIWYCDDGSIIRKKARICTNSFQREHLESVVIALKNKFGFEKIWIDKDNMLLFSANDSRRIRAIIKPFVPPCMEYKLEE